MLVSSFFVLHCYNSFIKLIFIIHFNVKVVGR